MLGLKVIFSDLQGVQHGLSRLSVLSKLGNSPHQQVLSWDTYQKSDNLKAVFAFHPKSKAYVYQASVEEQETQDKNAKYMSCTHCERMPSTFLVTQPYEVGSVIISVFQMKKRRFRDAEQRVRHHTAANLGQPSQYNSTSCNPIWVYL